MGKIATGKSVGTTDVGYKDIKVGDILKSRDNGLQYKVTNYGTLQSVLDKGIIIKKWDGVHFVVVQTFGEAAAAEKAAEQREEIKEDVRSLVREQPDDEAMTEEIIKALAGASPEPASAVTDAELVAELRARGWEVKCTRTITEEL